MLGRVRPGRLGKACRIWKIHIRRSVGKPWTSFPALLLFCGRTIWGILRLLTQALNDVQELKCGAGRGGNVDAEAQSLRHSEAMQWPWNPLFRGGVVRCRYREQPTRGFFGR